MLRVSWPPVRNIFIPDPGWVIFDVDLQGADAQVVAWEAGDEDLKAAFRAGKKIHAHNALSLLGPEIAGEDGKREPWYTRVKRGIHLLHYGGTVPTLAKKCAMSLREAETFQHDWFSLHPAIVEWHERTMFDVQTKGRTSNKFGYSIDWFDRPSQAVWRKALAWSPQSTVAHITEEAMIRLYAERENDPTFRRGFNILMNVHDSLVFQVKYDLTRHILPRVYDILHSIVVPYDDPLIIPWGVKRGRKSWGECKECKWEELLAAV